MMGGQTCTFFGCRPAYSGTPWRGSLSCFRSFSLPAAGLHLELCIKRIVNKQAQLD